MERFSDAGFSEVQDMVAQLRVATTRIDRLVQHGGPWYAIYFRLVSDALGDLFAPLDSTTPFEWDDAYEFLSSEYGQYVAWGAEIPYGEPRKLLERYAAELFQIRESLEACAP